MPTSEITWRMPSMKGACAATGLSARTLQRRCEEEMKFGWRGVHLREARILRAMELLAQVRAPSDRSQRSGSKPERLHAGILEKGRHVPKRICEAELRVPMRRCVEGCLTAENEARPTISASPVLEPLAIHPSLSSRRAIDYRDPPLPRVTRRDDIPVIDFADLPVLRSRASAYG